MQATRIILCALVAVASASACSKSPPEASAPAAKAQAAEAAPAANGAAAITQADRTEAKEIFQNRCTPCHGQTGGGDGPASAGLTPRPRNFHDAAWQGKTSDEHIEKIIQYGGAAVGLAPMMPANPDLTDKPGTVAALREHIRSLKQ